MTQLERDDSSVGNPRFRLGPLARQLAEEFTQGGPAGQQSLEDGIRDLRERLARLEGSSDGAIVDALQSETDQLMVDITGLITRQSKRMDAQFETVVHAINAIRFMMNFFAQAAGGDDLHDMLEGFNEAFDKELISIRESQAAVRAMTVERDAEAREEEGVELEHDAVGEMDQHAVDDPVRAAERDLHEMAMARGGMDERGH